MPYPWVFLSQNVIACVRIDSKASQGRGCVTDQTQVLGLFDRSVSVDQERTTVDHIAFTIGLPDYDSERKRLETLGLNVEVQEH